MLIPDGTLGANLILSVPSEGLGQGRWRGIQIGISATQFFLTAGLGLFGGFGPKGGVNFSNGPLTTGVTSAQHVDVEGGASASAGIDLPSMNSDQPSASASFPTFKPGVGLGAYAGYEKSWTETYA